MTCGRIASLAFVLMLTGAGGALAQETQGLNFLDGGKPLSGVPVSQVLDGGKSTLTTTGTDGTVSIPIDALGFGKGETVVVWVKRCEDGTVTEVILTREGEANPCPPGEGAQAGAACGCEKLGTFVVGDGPVTFDVGRPTFFQRIGVGVGIDFYQWLNFEDVAQNALGGFTTEASRTSTGFQAFAEYPCSRFPLSVGLEGSYTSLDVRTPISTIQNPMGVRTGDVNYFAFGPYVRFHPRTKRFQPYGLLSALYAWNEADFEFDGETDHRTHETWRAGFGGGFQYHLNPKLAVRADGMYSTTFQDNDADDHIRWKFGLLYRPGGTHVDY